MDRFQVWYDNVNAPLYRVLASVAGLWTLATVGYYVALPVFGYELSYNTAPVVIACYFLVWAAISFLYFLDLFRAWQSRDTRLWWYGGASLVCAMVVWGLLYELSLVPILRGPQLAPYSDILLSTPWYFLPKSVEILMQQILTTVVILALHSRLGSFKKVLIGYAVCFGGAHVLLFALSGAPTPYALIMTVGAMLSTFVFPYLILRVRGGFVYTYAIHLIFYILLAMLLRTWPPPGYFGS